MGASIYFLESGGNFRGSGGSFRASSGSFHYTKDKELRRKPDRSSPGRMLDHAEHVLPSFYTAGAAVASSTLPATTPSSRGASGSRRECISYDARRPSPAFVCKHVGPYTCYGTWYKKSPRNYEHRLVIF